MEFRLYDETPSQQDLFDGQNHSNLANKISSILNRKDINTIGLDGCLGSGKSTVLALIKNQLQENDKITFIDFDVELYHHGSTKKALINVLHDGMRPKIKSYVAEAFSDYKNIALGNKFSYEKKQNSSMSTWTFSFIFTSLLSLQSFRFFLLDFSKFMNNEPFSKLTLLAESFLLISPIITLFFFSLFRDKNNSINFSDIIKKNSVDTITETVLISKEVGALELKGALSGFLKCTDDHTFILTIDNLDRVSKEKVKEIWSDIELITHNSNSKLKIIIPYSAEHLAKSLSDKDDNVNEGMEFLSKRLPVTFRVPPIISTGWRSAFDYFWRETFSNNYIDQSKEIAQLIETWLPQNYMQVTPRLLKRLINDVNISIFTTPKTVSPIAASFYILSCRYNNSPFIWATLNYDTENIEDFLTLHNVPKEYYEKYSSSYPQLQRLYENNKNNWIEEILCLHFQTNEDLAKSELIGEPLLLAINQGNASDFFRLTDTFGFESIWRATLDKTDPTKWIKLLSEADDNHISTSQNIIIDVIKSLNTKKLTVESTSLNIELIQSLEKLKSKKINIQGVYLTDIKNNLSAAITDYNRQSFDDSKNNMDKNNCESILKIANYFCRLDDDDETTSKILISQKNISGVFFAKYLYSNMNELENLNITEITLTTQELIKSLHLLSSENSNFNLFDEFFLSRIKSNTEELYLEIKNDTFTAAQEALSILEAKEIIQNINQANLLVLSSAWHEKDMSKSHDSLDEIRESYPVNFVCLFLLNTIETQTYDINDIILRSSIDENILNSSEFNETLADHLLFSTSFEKIVLSLDETEVTNYVSEAIGLLLSRKKIARLHVANFIKTHYSILTSHYSREIILDFFSSWDQSSAREIKNEEVIKFENIDPLYLNDLLETKVLPLSYRAAIDHVKEKLAKHKEIPSLFVTIEKNAKAVITYCSKNGISLIKNSNDIFRLWFAETTYNEIIKAKNTRLIFDILSQKDKDVTIENLTDLVYQRDFDVKKQIVLIEQFGDLITLNDPDKSLINRTIIRLFPYAIESKNLAHWLDKQSFNFTRWKANEKDSVQSLILSNPDKFPNNASKLQKSRKKKKNE
ncbi:hypothetical protein [Enterobacter cloacae]|uniref:hypothetical protein n=1 Tax=Enterobacter cloacae TaxID=550 RepID=UPI002873F493|nr:hypothetical protein [Enterobacter cloacae]MDR9934686.1 hypothetical protein [Enterobacter cloacae subsp. dissolvens]